ncbi:MAG: His-Xaa-Ser system radical SAM maturase HxsB [Candidatus Omnitrophica bacterium]|nr:His-Xaa-Ser system radical SAM maturase HxsB [Candidatus Omnitrophota bacterium]
MQTLDTDWAVIPHNARKFDDKYLVTNLLGSFVFLSKDEYSQLTLSKLNKKSALFNRLYKAGIVLTDDNVASAISDFRNSNLSLFHDPSLHIAVLTTRCNLACKYCQTSNSKKSDMNKEVASGILEYLTKVKYRPFVLEFQGGEPLLNWEVLEFLVKGARKFIQDDNELVISLVSNLILLDKEKTDFLVEHKVRICASLDGPQKLHDKNRVFLNNQGSYSKVVKGIKMIEATYKKRKVESNTRLIPTITRHSLVFAREIIDEYLKLKESVIYLKAIKQIGVADKSWEELGYTPEEFIEFWKRAMDYIIELNKKGKDIQEWSSVLLLKKIMHKQDHGHVDMMNPCGAGRAVLTYMPDGNIYPCDEARMIKNSDLFVLGNVLRNRYEDIFKNENLFAVCSASVMQLWDYASAYLPWKGTCPVLNYSSGNNLIPQIKTTPMDKILEFQLDYLFSNLAKDGEVAAIFKRWLMKGGSIYA